MNVYIYLYICTYTYIYTLHASWPVVLVAPTTSTISPEALAAALAGWHALAATSAVQAAVSSTRLLGNMPDSEEVCCGVLQCDAACCSDVSNVSNSTCAMRKAEAVRGVAGVKPPMWREVCCSLGVAGRSGPEKSTEKLPADGARITRSMDDKHVAAIL